MFPLIIRKNIKFYKSYKAERYHHPAKPNIQKGVSDIPTKFILLQDKAYRYDEEKSGYYYRQRADFNR